MLNSKVIKNTEQPKIEKVKKSNKLLYSLGAIIIGLLIGMIFILISGNSVSAYFSNLWKGSFGNLANFGNLLGNLAWVIPIGLAMVVSFRAGIFNIGSAGQMLFAGFISYLIAIAIGSSMGSFGIVLIAFVAIISGAFLAWIMAILKTKFKIHEVITSIMFSWIVFWFVSWGYTNIDYIAGETIGTVKNFDSVLSLKQDWISNLFGGSEKMNIGIFVSILLIGLLIVLYKFTNFGFKQEIIGSNNKVFEYVGLNKNREYFKSLLLSGSLAGIAGWIYFFGLQDSFPKQVWQINADLYQGITVALIGFNSFGGAFASSIFISIFMNSGDLANSTVGSLPVSDLILAIIIIILALSQFLIIYRPQDNWFKEENPEPEVELNFEENSKAVIDKAKKDNKPKIENKTKTTKITGTKKIKKQEEPEELIGLRRFVSEAEEIMALRPKSTDPVFKEKDQIIREKMINKTNLGVNTSFKEFEEEKFVDKNTVDKKEIIKNQEKLLKETELKNQEKKEKLLKEMELKKQEKEKLLKEIELKNKKANLEKELEEKEIKNQKEDEEIDDEDGYFIDVEVEDGSDDLDLKEEEQTDSKEEKTENIPEPKSVEEILENYNKQMLAEKKNKINKEEN